MLTHFSYGKPFLEINSGVLKRYAACTSEEEIKQAEEKWLAKIEKEWVDNRGDGGGGDAWEGGNKNQKEEEEVDSDDDSGEEEGSGGATSEKTDAEEEDEEEGGVGISRDPLDLSSDTDDAEEMAEIRRRVLQSKPFSNPAPNTTDTSKGSLSENKISRHHRNTVSAMTADSDTSDSDSSNNDNDGDVDDAAFDAIINATPVTDRTGILAKQQQQQPRRGVGNREQNIASGSFSRAQVGAPKRW